MTFNVWGVWGSNPLLTERIERIGAAIAELRPDVVAFQEVWQREDALALATELERRGLEHIHVFGTKRTGLFIASRYPISAPRYEAFETKGMYPAMPWHADWLGDKGVGVVDVHTPIGRVRFADTHLCASYDGETYAGTRILQALQTGAFVSSGKDAFGAPLVVAGDINSAPGDLARRILIARAGLHSVEPEQPTDAVLFRSGGTLEAHSGPLEPVLDGAFDLGMGNRGPLSDHAAFMVDLMVVETTTTSVLPDPSWPDTARAAVSEIDALIEDKRTRAHVALGLAVFLALGAAWLLWKKHRAKRASRVIYLLVALLMSGAGYGIYFGAQSARMRINDLELAKAALIRESSGSPAERPRDPRTPVDPP